MRHHSCSPNNLSKQNGVVMFVALILLLILSLLGVTAARMQTVEERMAFNDGNRQVAQQAAEAALRSAETRLITGLYDFASGGPGLYEPILATGSPLTNLNWSIAANVAPYAGPMLADLPPAARTPKIVLEDITPVAIAGNDISVQSLNSPNPVTVVRVTVQGTGADATSTTTLQSIVR